VNLANYGSFVKLFQQFFWRMLCAYSCEGKTALFLGWGWTVANLLYICYQYWRYWCCTSAFCQLEGEGKVWKQMLTRPTWGKRATEHEVSVTICNTKWEVVQCAWDRTSLLLIYHVGVVFGPWICECCRTSICEMFDLRNIATIR